MSLCIETACTQPAKARQLCNRHYKHRVYNDIPLPPRVRAENVGKPCATPGCPKKAAVSGWCRACYVQVRRTGATERQRIVGDIEKRLWQGTTTTEDGCWQRAGKTDVKGYCLFTTLQGHQRLHTAAYDLFVGDRPDGWHVHHLCWNKRCWNPAHLVAVSPSHHSTIHRWSEARKAGTTAPSPALS